EIERRLADPYPTFLTLEGYVDESCNGAVKVLIRCPFVPAEAGTQGFGQRTRLPLPRERTELARSKATSSGRDRHEKNIRRRHAVDRGNRRGRRRNLAGAAGEGDRGICRRRADRPGGTSDFAEAFRADRQEFLCREHRRCRRQHRYRPC